jgi:hypothetical protein
LKCLKVPPPLLLQANFSQFVALLEEELEELHIEDGEGLVDQDYAFEYHRRYILLLHAQLDLYGLNEVAYILISYWRSLRLASGIVDGHHI